MSTLEKITRAGELRNDGNDRFAKGAYERASRRYSAALNLISVDQVGFIIQLVQLFCPYISVSGNDVK